MATVASVRELLAEAKERHTTYIFMGRGNQGAPSPDPSQQNEFHHDHITAGMREWFADTQSAANALSESGVVEGVVNETLLHQWQTIPRVSDVLESDSLIQTTIQAAQNGDFIDTTTLVIHWVWTFAECLLPMAAAPSHAKPHPGAWPSAHRPFFQNTESANLKLVSLPWFIWELTRFMPQLTRLHILGGSHPAAAYACSPTAQIAMTKWLSRVNTGCVFTANPDEVPAHWVAAERPLAVRWLGGFNDSGGAGIDLQLQPQQPPMHPHPQSYGDSQEATKTDLDELALVAGMFQASSLADMAHRAACTNGLWRELLLTAYLPPHPSGGMLGARLLELHLHGMHLSSRDVAALPLVFPALRFLRLYYCRGYSRLAMESTAEHFSDPNLGMLGGHSMYQTGPQFCLSHWLAARGHLAFLGRDSTPVHDCIAGKTKFRLVPRANSALHGPWQRRRHAVLLRSAAGQSRGARQAQHSAHTQQGGFTVTDTLKQRVFGPVLLALCALRVEQQQTLVPHQPLPPAALHTYTPQTGISSALTGKHARSNALDGSSPPSACDDSTHPPLWWWRGSQYEECMLSGGEQVLKREASAGASAPGSADAVGPEVKQLLHLAPVLGLRCSPQRAGSLLSAAARVPGSSTAGYSVLDHDRDEISGAYWPVGGDWRKGGFAWPHQEPQCEAGWAHFWGEPGMV